MSARMSLAENTLADIKHHATVLVVDDTPQNLGLLGELLQPFYRVRIANSGERALQIANSLPKPDIILLDVMMPEMDGHAVMRHLQADPTTRDIPVIFITAMSSSEDEGIGLSLGAVDYITKPITPSIVLARVRTHLELKWARDMLADENGRLEREVARRMSENLLIQNLSVRALACLAEARDNETGRHILRTQSYVSVLASHLAKHPRFEPDLAENRLNMVIKATPLHDIGKVGIPDAILLKPARLTPAEFETMKTHTTIGAQAIDRAMRQAMEQAADTDAAQASTAFAFLRIAEEISLCHHEKFDGSGYPAGLKGDSIPVSARLMALADVFDAVLCRRIYKDPVSLDMTIDTILRGRGSHFDPDVVDAFTACRDQFVEIAHRHADTNAEGVS